MANIEVMYSSKTDQWFTPMEFFKELDQEFHFNLDPCADENNHKCEKFFDKQTNGLLQDWGGILYSAILHTAQKLENGLRNVTKRERNQTP